MAPPTRISAFLAGLIVVFAVSFGLGGALDVSAPGASAEQGGHEQGGHMEGMEGAHPVRGLGVAEAGLRLELADPDLARGVDQSLGFQVVDETGAPVTDFDLTHTKRMHVIVVRRDLTGFQHLHPEMAADGTWAVPLRLAAAGTYRVFVDFSRNGEVVTLADDLRVDGAADLHGLPAPATRVLSEPAGYEVELASDEGHSGAHAGEEASLRFTVSRDGRSATLQSYLGAGGHLVALRQGDLAFLHVHPSGDAGRDGSIEFEVTFPTAGSYRLFLQFVVAGELQTTAFTAEVH